MPARLNERWVRIVTQWKLEGGFRLIANEVKGGEDKKQEHKGKEVWTQVGERF